MTSPNAPLTPDALSQHWSLRFLPRWTRPYARLMRLERPIGWQLLLWPCVFASLLASVAGDSALAWQHLLLFALGAVIMRGAGCTLNDIVDRDIDAQVARTAARPIPSGEISTKGAVLFLGLLLLVGLLILLSFNSFTVALGLSSVGLVVIYPFMKRITNWPQLVLGLAFAWGALVGWSAQMETISLPALFLYAGCVLWIVGYDTIYAFQDLEDDAIAGVGSSAQALGDKAPIFIGLFYSLQILAWTAAFVFAGVGWPSYAGLIAATAHLGWQVTTLDLSDPDVCLARFKSNNVVGLAIVIGLAVDVFV